ncbi:DUF3243 domain-containing protein [bacterium LRH843]|nr:DUF3243 domain-containing protein [bacterium LRH843]
MTEENHIVTKSGDVAIEKIDNVIERIDDEKMNEILDSFEGFKTYLKDRVAIAKKIGLDEEQLAEAAEEIGTYLADHVSPKNREEKLLMELWKTANKDEQHSLAHILVKLVNEDS